MINSLFIQYLRNYLLDTQNKPVEFQLKFINDKIAIDSQNVEYQIQSFDQNFDLKQLISDTESHFVQNYSFNYTFDLAKNQMENQICQISQLDFKEINLTLQFQVNTQSINYAGKVFIKQSAPHPLLPTHQIFFAQKTQKQEIGNFEDLEFKYQRQQTEFKIKQERKQNATKKQKKSQKETNKIIVKKEKEQIVDFDKIDIENVQIINNSQQQQKEQKEFVPKQLFKKKKIEEHSRLLQLARKLNIPEQWKQVSQEYQIQHKKKWDVKYFEKLALLKEIISKKYFYQYQKSSLEQTMQEDIKNNLIKFIFSPDNDDPELNKRRKIYSKDVVCSLMD